GELASTRTDIVERSSDLIGGCGDDAAPGDPVFFLAGLLLVILMIVKEESYRALERRCFPQIADGTRAVEELTLELGGYSVPAHDQRRAQALRDLLFFLGERRAVF